MENIILYSTNCPKCMVLKEKMDAKNIKYTTEIDVEKMLSLGIKAVPMLDVGGNLMNFTQAVNWIKEV